MTSEIKYLVFKGIEKKEQILFKSFLNLSKNELAYQIIILKEGDTSESPDILIMDEHYEVADLESAAQEFAAIVVGADIQETKNGYIARPVQWSDFKTALSQLNIEESVSAGGQGERVLPNEVKFALPDIDQPTEDVLEPISPEAAEAAEAGFSDPASQEYELDNMSVDYHSVTNSDFGKAADDVKQFIDGEALAAVEPLIMFTDDESASVNSVLVIETNSLDAWDFSESEMSSDLKDDGANVAGSKEFDEGQESEVVLERKAGFDIAEGEEYWLEETEVIVDHEGILFIKPERDLVYSAYEPGRWLQLLMNKPLSKLPLSKDWRPKHDLTGYPITNLLWVNTLLNDTKTLSDDLDPEQEYMLEQWPDFDLIQLDNILLKLCTMLFVRAETVASLSQKSGYSMSTIYGLVNACHQSGLIKKAEDIQLEQLTAVGGEGSMLGKIKDVFR